MALYPAHDVERGRVGVEVRRRTRGPRGRTYFGQSSAIWPRPSDHDMAESSSRTTTRPRRRHSLVYDGIYVPCFHATESSPSLGRWIDLWTRPRENPWVRCFRSQGGPRGSVAAMEFHSFIHCSGRADKSVRQKSSRISSSCCSRAAAAAFRREGGREAGRQPRGLLLTQLGCGGRRAAEARGWSVVGLQSCEFLVVNSADVPSSSWWWWCLLAR
ncbi:hypothetical protein Mp_7g04200 [Marchantia polymorpha subsp. ruderalis]|uniref:Uncharacterized protein n=2 Tax=Marchantia polymorpha TaxID=3197 RepID=A0AAF6BW04_MARPO|nr:hypothetical protein MARPO_0062s0105 [Marchantia polymorpha]BBN16188.1 hypothetical protein Mp_7g04200 [Marchantia polymorpha subsp. ruderalis]|eukprot:PTQ36694.1 hypothetical protein MARPO_0062s0105 [Marchantia polymorpha]